MIRIATEADVPAILAIYAPYVENTTVSFEYDVPCRKEFMQRFYTITEQFPWLVWEENGEILGYAYAAPPYARAAYSWCAEPSVYLKPTARGRGIGRMLYAALEEILKIQGYQVLYALITQENDPSLAFHQKLGYEIKVLFPDCGFKFGRWLGVYWLEKRLKTVEIPKSFPTPFPKLGQDSQRISDILYKLSLS
jgi:phosphinothricin acetyltransferase